MKKRTIKDLDVYLFICAHKEANGGENPKYREICNRFECCYTAAVASVRRLIAVGLLEKTPGGYAVEGGTFTPPKLPDWAADMLKQYRYGGAE